MSDEQIRELERRFHAGEEDLADELIRRKIQAAGTAEIARSAAEFALGSVLDRPPTKNELLFWIEHRALPCTAGLCTNPAENSFAHSTWRWCERHSVPETNVGGGGGGGAGGGLLIVRPDPGHFFDLPGEG